MNKLDQDLLSAAKKGEIDNIESALKWGADIDAVDADGYSSLILASEYGHTDCADLLITSGSNINYIVKNPVIGQTTALKHSCYLGQFDIVKKLLHLGGDIKYIVHTRS
ncbi:MAG: ankyrin repeat domain-containing protein, partial [Methylomonas sp.]|nr:ankyrin repeat domain-containing protein [Methylomonas sp.]